MARIVYGDRIGKQGQLAIGCSAWIFDSTTQKLLLVQRADNRRWAVPGGYMEPGESVTEACEREVLEEAGVQVKAAALIALYNDPNLLLEYPDGNKWQLIVLHFAAEIVGGKISIGDETTAVGFFTVAEMATMDLGPFDRRRVNDGFAFQKSTFIRDELHI